MIIVFIMLYRQMGWVVWKELTYYKRKDNKGNYFWTSSIYKTPVAVHNVQIETVSSYKYLGVYVDAALLWCIWLIKSDSKGIYNVRNDFCFK